MSDFQFTLDTKMMDSLLEYSQLLHRTPSCIIKDALEEHFLKLEQEILEKSMENENALTTLSYDEFWEGVEV